MTQISWLGEVASKGTAILAAAFVAAALLRRASAAARHFLWTETLCALLLLPLVIWITPSWKIAPAVLLPASQVSEVTTLVVRPHTASPLTIPWLLLWALGAAVAGTRFATGAAYTRRLVRRSAHAGYAATAAAEIARALGIRRKVTVLESEAAPVPLACGVLCPAVVLPRGASEWPATRLVTVLRHELVHVRRWDLAAQALAQVVCSLYWFHPLAWLAARKLRQERERACDDAVLAAGIAPHDYAAELVDLARGLASRRRSWANASAMAETSDLESRVRALFERRNRRPLGIKGAIAIELAVLALLLPVAALKVHAQTPGGGLAGIVVDPSGARVPNAKVVVQNLNGTTQQTIMSDAAGEYRFNGLLPGDYTLQIDMRGFKRARINATVVAGQVSRIDGRLAVGDVSESITVTGVKPPTVTPNVMGTHDRVRVGGNVQPVMLVKQTPPEYPAELQQAGVQGIVTIQAIISKDGEPLNPRVLSTNVDPRLIQLALSAYQQWRYKPALLNGEPIETLTKVDIEFTLN